MPLTSSKIDGLSILKILLLAMTKEHLLGPYKTSFEGFKQGFEAIFFQKFTEIWLFETLNLKKSFWMWVAAYRS